MFLASAVISLFNYTLQPAWPFSYFDLPISSLDLLGAVRLCLVLRQIREINRKAYVRKAGQVEEKSYTKDLATTLLVVFGGEAVITPLMGIPPSFMISATFPLLFVGIHTLIESLPAVPAPSLQSELPFSILDAFTRTALLCSFVPPTILRSPSLDINTSPWALLLTSLVVANGGFFLANLLSCLHPTSLTLTTPLELRPYGWSSADLWCAPLITGLYALLTHAQPFWAEVHAMILGVYAPGCTNDEAKLSGVCGIESVRKLDQDTARAICALVLCTLFAGRTIKVFAGELKWGPLRHPVVKDKTQ